MDYECFLCLKLQYCESINDINLDKIGQVTYCDDCLFTCIRNNDLTCPATTNVYILASKCDDKGTILERKWFNNLQDLDNDKVMKEYKASVERGIHGPEYWSCTIIDRNESSISTKYFDDHKNQKEWITTGVDPSDFLKSYHSYDLDYVMKPGRWYIHDLLNIYDISDYVRREFKKGFVFHLNQHLRKRHTQLIDDKISQWKKRKEVFEIA
ncbi:MAG: hypothetical protein Sylvanvirus17_4 [Sylvanvirus sp.]|uniref:Uncharacterized protein n=1 Tax=Sylvanvirus sp. TaxID=2487774 RepID=A0A3G5AIE5_9VIRU|nr:MAG: hypothetical protein Sylvanvirus17_4 [Sylvanvirus sp.]